MERNLMTKLQIQRYKEQLENIDNYLINYLKTEPFPDRKEIMMWSANLGMLFKDIGLPDFIIKDFLAVFDVRNDQKNIVHYKERMTQAIRNGKTEGLLSNHIFVPIEIAKCTALVRLEQLEGDHKLVPKWLIEEVGRIPSLNHIYSLLKALQTSFDDKSPEGLCSNANSLLSAILNLHPDLASKEIGTQLQILIDEKNDGKLKLSFGGLSKDFFRGLNNSRLIRNVRTTHSTKSMKHNIPLLVGMASAYLVITLLETTLANGNLIE